MTLTYVLMQNLKRNRLRTALTLVAFALPMGIFVLAISFVVAMVQLAQQSEKQLRLAVHHKTTLTNLLPAGMRRKIEALDPDRSRLRAVCGMRWFGGRVPDTQNTLTSLAADADTFPIVYSDVGMTEDEIELWNRERTAAVVGTGPADTYGWKVGDRVVLESTVPPYLTLEFKIVKVISNPERSNFFYFRLDYLNESREAVGASSARCNIFWTKCNSAEGMRSLQAQIDKTFANTPDETKSEDENAFAASFTQANGNLPGLMQAMAIVVVFIVTLVAGNTMMMSFRERTCELAIFKAIGFQRGRIFVIVLAESVMLSFVGSLCGVIPTSLGLLYFPLTLTRLGPLPRLEVSFSAVIASIVIAVAVGFASGLWPAFQSMRLKPADALRKIA
ncbi:MAG: ABC transporter permease [Planctomycetes bacterium]|nr:ABC transporter permease [Planctomycetota bacterium]